MADPIRAVVEDRDDDRAAAGHGGVVGGCVGVGDESGDRLACRPADPRRCSSLAAQGRHLYWPRPRGGGR